MIPWIQVYSNLISHPKTARLADALKLTSKDTSPNVVAAGMLVSLWTWAIQNAHTGDLSDCSDRAIADAARFRRKPEAFVKALTECGWLDADRHLHDWEEYTHQLIERIERGRKQTKARVQRYRNKNVTPDSAPSKSQGNAHCNASCNVTVTQCNAPTLPNLTLPLPIDSAHKTVDGKTLPQEPPAPFDGKSFTLFWDAYPNKIDRNAAWEAWQALRPDSATAKTILKALAVWKASGGWSDEDGRYIPHADNFLSKGYWKSPPAPQPRPRSSSGSWTQMSRPPSGK